MIDDADTLCHCPASRLAEEAAKMRRPQIRVNATDRTRIRAACKDPATSDITGIEVVVDATVPAGRMLLIDVEPPTLRPFIWTTWERS